jgi:Flp pilus assembly pilin Flp
MLACLRARIVRLGCDEEGASLVEYILLILLIAIASVAGTTFLGMAANNRVNNIGAVME